MPRLPLPVFGLFLLFFSIYCRRYLCDFCVYVLEKKTIFFLFLIFSLVPCARPADSFLPAFKHTLVWIHCYYYCNSILLLLLLLLLLLFLYLFVHCMHANYIHTLVSMHYSFIIYIFIIKYYNMLFCFTLCGQCRAIKIMLITHHRTLAVTLMWLP